MGPNRTEIRLIAFLEGSRRRGYLTRGVSNTVYTYFAAFGGGECNVRSNHGHVAQLRASLERPQSLGDFWPHKRLDILMASPASLKRKQNASAGEAHTLLDFFGTKRPKPSPSRPSGVVSLGKPVGADLDPIVISDDDDCVGESSTTIRPEPILDLSFTEDEWEAEDDELLVMEDDEPDFGEAQADPPNHKSSECLGNTLLAVSVSLGTCTICGLLLLDTTDTVGVSCPRIFFLIRCLFC
jgi:hypothetical protein